MATIGVLRIGMSVATGGLAKGLSNASGAVSSFASRVSSVGGGVITSFAKMGLAIQGVETIARGLVSVVSGPLKLAASAEQTAVSFKVMLGSAEKADAMIRELTDFAATTPFEFPGITDAAKKLLAFGIDAKDITPTLRRLGDVASGLGIPLGEISEIYGKAKVQGRLFAEDINQLTGRGIPIIGQLAKQFGVAETAVKKMVEDGQVNFGHLETAFISLTGEGGQFAGLMAAQSQTLGGMWSTLTDNLNLALTEIGASIATTFDLKGAMVSITTFIGSAMPAIKAFLADFKAGWEFVLPVVTQVIDNIKAQWMVLSEAAFSAVGYITDVLNGFGLNFGTIRDFILEALMRVEFGWQNWQRIGELAVKNVLLSVVSFAGQVQHLFTQVIPHTLVWLADNWSTILHDMGETAGTIFGNLSNNIVNILKNLPALIRGKVKFGDLWTPLLEGAQYQLSTLPDIPERAMSEMEQKLRTDVASLGTSLEQDFQAFKGEKLKTLMPPKPIEAIKGMDEVKAKAAEATATLSGAKVGATGKLELASVAELGSKEARDSIIRHRFGGSNDPMKNVEKNGKEHLAVARQTLPVLKQIAAKQETVLAF